MWIVCSCGNEAISQCHAGQARNGSTPTLEVNMHRCFFVLLILAGIPRAGHAQEQNELLFSRLSEKTLFKLLTESKVKYEKKSVEVKGKSTVEYWMTFSSGYKAILRNRGTFLFVQSAGFKTLNNQDISFESSNEWNKKWVLCPAVLGSDGSGIVTSAISILDGTNQKIIKRWLREYDLSLKKFAEYTR
ncbi:MAG: hypothetical protein HYX68_02620 [Planctomycetes bacterium]|nr:hypothetical protein [Planctomycetota bacterium]